MLSEAGLPRQLSNKPYEHVRIDRQNVDIAVSRMQHMFGMPEKVFMLRDGTENKLDIRCL